MSPSTATTSLVMVNGSSGPSRSASHHEPSRARPTIGCAHGDGRYDTSGENSSASAPVPGARQARTYPATHLLTASLCTPPCCHPPRELLRQGGVRCGGGG